MVRKCLVAGLVGGLLLLPMDSRISSPPEDLNRAAVRLLLGGDVHTGERLRSRIRRSGAGWFSSPLSGVTRDVDLHLANLEGPISTRDTSPLDKQYLLRNPPRIAVPVLKSLGVDGVSLANNHIMDYQTEGLRRTLRVLERAGIEYAGAGLNQRQAEQPVLFRRHGQLIGFLSFSNTLPESFWADGRKPGAAFGHFQRMSRRVSEVSDRTDFTVVSFHWGVELDTRPQNYQVSLARQAVRSGADVVFGHHAHTLLPVERYRGGLIFYGLGNYLFTSLSHDVGYGLLAEVTLRGRRAPGYRLHLINVNNYQVDYRPQPIGQYEDPHRLARFLNRPRFAGGVGLDTGTRSKKSAVAARKQGGTLKVP